MKNRELGKNGRKVSEVGLGCWQLGGGWGKPWCDKIAQEILSNAYATGVRFFDTANGYGGGGSERSLGRFRQEHPDVIIATKLGRCGLYPDRYSRETLREATLASMARLGVNSIDLTQLHCLPIEILRDGKVFNWLREQRDEGLISQFGASVETVEEGLICLEQEGITSLQIIFNLFRQKPLKNLLPKAYENGIGVIARLPLASGLLTGKFNEFTEFHEDDHRNFNQDGQKFNIGETFSGIKFKKGVELVERLKKILPEGMSMSQVSLRWILDHEAISVVIPGASAPYQANMNSTASTLSPLSDKLYMALQIFYERQVRAHIRGPY